MHRIGRTGRVGNPGRATIFWEEDSPNASALREDIATVRFAMHFVLFAYLLPL